MKSLYLFLFLFSFTAFSSQNHLTDIPLLTIEKIAKYDYHPEHSFRIEAKPGEEISIKPENLAALKGLKIHHIDLVYTAYRGKKTYNQNAVNKQQIEALKKVFPQTVSDDPTWKCIEQTGASSTKEAKSYFHGFVVHYGPSLDYQHLSAFFQPFQMPAKTFTVNAKEGGKFDCGEGTFVTIKGNSVTNADGTPIEGSYTLQYKEFKDPADILFSGIPMTYNYGRQSNNFSSVGMYDLRAEQDGKSLKMSAPANVDFNCTQVDKGVAFYQMDDQSGEWVKKKDVAFRAPLKLLSTAQNKLSFDGIEFELNSKIYNHYSVISFNESCWEWVFNHFATHPKLSGALEKIDEENRTAQTTISPRQFMEMVAEIVMEEKKAEMQRELERQIAEEKQRIAEWQEQERKRLEAERLEQERLRRENARYSNTLLAEGINEGHTYPALVKGLNSPSFGVYNCDQIYQLQDPVELAPIYVDESGREIINKHVVCVMDLNYNGSFSFHPNNITCSAKGKNVILLFTDNKDVYMLSEEQFDQLNLDGNLRPKFEMKNMTSVIKTSDDLKEYLKI